MSEGRSELEKAIEVWERRHAAAVQAKREAEVVMPFLRAAVEELDSFHAGNPAVDAPVAAAPIVTETAPPQHTAPSAFDGDFEAVIDEADDDTAGSDAPTEFPNVFQARAIASLVDDDEADDEAAAV